jgi:hypothetical protein
MSRPEPVATLHRLVIAAVPLFRYGAPKRNVLLGLAYLLVALFLWGVHP